MTSQSKRFTNEYFPQQKHTNQIKINKRQIKLPKLKKNVKKSEESTQRKHHFMSINVLPYIFQNKKVIPPYEYDRLKKSNLNKNPSIEVFDRRMKKIQRQSSQEINSIKSNEYRLRTEIGKVEKQSQKNIKDQKEIKIQFSEQLQQIKIIVENQQSQSGSKDILTFLNAEIQLDQFQKRIKQNREIIKRQTSSRRKQISQYIQNNLSISKCSKKNQSREHQRQSQYIKFSKPRKDLNKNKLLINQFPKKKRNVNSNKVRGSIDKLNGTKMIKNTISNVRISNTPNLLPGMIIKKDQSSLISNENMFDNIQELLRKVPRYKSEEPKLQKVKSENFKDKLADLEKKYRQLEKKQSQATRFNRQKINTEFSMNSHKWNNIQMIEQKFEKIDSGISNRIDQINKHLMKNQECMNDYIETKKMIVELQYQQRYNTHSRNSLKKQYINNTQVLI